MTTKIICDDVPSAEPEMKAMDSDVFRVILDYILFAGWLAAVASFISKYTICCDGPIDDEQCAVLFIYLSFQRMFNSLGFGSIEDNTDVCGAFSCAHC